MIYAGIVRRKMRNFLIFKDIRVFKIFKRDKSMKSSSSRYRFMIDDVTFEIEIEIEIENKVNSICKSFIITSDINNHEYKEFIMLRVDLSDRKD